MSQTAFAVRDLLLHGRCIGENDEKSHLYRVEVMLCHGRTYVAFYARGQDCWCLDLKSTMVGRNSLRFSSAERSRCERETNVSDWEDIFASFYWLLTSSSNHWPPVLDEVKLSITANFIIATDFHIAALRSNEQHQERLSRQGVHAINRTRTEWRSSLVGSLARSEWVLT
jgi:hypothetical protein